MPFYTAFPNSDSEESYQQRPRSPILRPLHWRTSFYQRTANHVFFIWFSICATYHTLSARYLHITHYPKTNVITPMRRELNRFTIIKKWNCC